MTQTTLQAHGAKSLLSFHSKADSDVHPFTVGSSPHNPMQLANWHRREALIVTGTSKDGPWRASYSYQGGNNHFSHVIVPSFFFLLCVCVWVNVCVFTGVGWGVFLWWVYMQCVDARGQC